MKIWFEVRGTVKIPTGDNLHSLPIPIELGCWLLPLAVRSRVDVCSMSAWLTILSGIDFAEVQSHNGLPSTLDIQLIEGSSKHGRQSFLPSSVRGRRCCGGSETSRTVLLDGWFLPGWMLGRRSSGTRLSARRCVLRRSERERDVYGQAGCWVSALATALELLKKGMGIALCWCSSWQGLQAVSVDSGVKLNYDTSCIYSLKQ